MPSKQTVEPMEMPNLKREDANVVCVIGKTQKHVFTVTLTQISTGAPGVGKGTQCTKLAKDLGVVHMCVGDLLRGDPDCESIMKKAGLVDYDKVRGLLKNVLDSHLKAGQNNILLDGFPRSPEQALFFQAEVQFQS